MTPTIDDRLTALEQRIAMLDDRDRINTIIQALNDYARRYDSYEYGLPVHDNANMAEMREIVVDILVGHIGD